MLRLDNLSVGYGGAPVVKNISLQIDNSIAIIGPNGCGKTTLLKGIAGIIPSSGNIFLDDRQFSRINPRETAKEIAMLSQQSSIYFSYTVYDTVMMGRYLQIKDRFPALPDQRDKTVVTQLLEAVGLLEEKDAEITKLSGGQMQRVFLARALAQEPRIILLDEPTNHLDLKCQVEIIGYLKNWAKEKGRIVVGVLHDINLALELSNRLVVMKNGEIAADSTNCDPLSGDILDAVYGMKVKEYMRKSFERWRD